MYRNTINRSGTKSSRDTVPTSIPPIVPTASEREPLQPTPVENIIGSSPNIMVREVIRMGRSRATAAATADAVMLIPLLRHSEAYSVWSMAVLASKPMSMMIPVCI